ncbi:MAG: ABC transporter permease [Actinobacteria bacterium]|nr:ABC transporter permease [Actinomycetota bacterium]
MRRVFSIAGKDLKLIFRNRFIAVISFLLIVFYGVVYHLLPKSVDETYKIGFYLNLKKETVRELSLSRIEIEKKLNEGNDKNKQEAIKIYWANSLADLKKLVLENKVSAGVRLELKEAKPNVTFYVSSRTPEEITQAGEMIAREIGYTLAGYRLPADFKATIIGTDMVGRQIPLRDKMRVLLLSFVFLFELYGVGNLLSEEVFKKTAYAILVTPATLTEFIAAKAITGVIMAFSEGFLLAIILNVLKTEIIFSLTLFLALGAFLIVGIAFIMGALSRDFITLVMSSIIPFVILIFPSLVVLDPGLSSPLLKAIPTYYLIEPLNGFLNYGAKFSEYTSSAFVLFLFSLAFFFFGFLILKRRLV